MGCTIAETAHITLGKCTLIIYLCLCSRQVSCANYVRTVRQSWLVAIPLATVILGIWHVAFPLANLILGIWRPVFMKLLIIYVIIYVRGSNYQLILSPCLENLSEQWTRFLSNCVIGLYNFHSAGKHDRGPLLFTLFSFRLIRSRSAGSIKFKIL